MTVHPNKQGQKQMEEWPIERVDGPDTSSALSGPQQVITTNSECPAFEAHQ